MGWRFRKIFRRGPFRLSLTKKGIGGSWGIPGLRFGISPSGQRYFSTGIPGTGLYYIKYFPMRQQPPQPTSQSQPILPHKYQKPPAPHVLKPPTPQPPIQNQQPWWKQKGLD